MHHHDNDGEQPGFMESTKRGFNVLIVGCQLVAFPLELLVREPGTMGKLYSRWRGPLSLLLAALGFALFSKPEDVHHVGYLWAGIIACLAVHRMKAVKLAREGRECHSNYD